MKKIELLAPAGNLECLKEAIGYGADAVYIGGKKFGARAYVDNFTIEEIEKGTDYAHLFGSRVFVTVNTLIKNTEIKEAVDYIAELYRIGADAVIVQDYALAEIIRKNFPGMEVHASTQTTIHNSDSAALAGCFDRIILARELSKDQIKKIIDSTDKPVEIFVHGALCFSFSGQCLMSSIIGGRSGNRGRCAQPCRKPYGKGDSPYLISTADLCLIEQVPEIIELGVHSMKIEGRMKPASYVGKVVSAYRKAIDSYYENRFHVSKKDKDELLLSFNRTFTKGFFNSEKSILATETPTNRGVFMGEVRDGKIRLKTSLAVGDGIAAGNRGGIVNAILRKGEIIRSAEEGDIVEIRSTFIPSGLAYKTSGAISLPEKRRIPLDIEIRIDKEIEVTASMQGARATAKAGAEKAMKSPLVKEKVIETFSKIKNTPFCLKKISCSIQRDVFVPFSRLTSLRDEALDSVREEMASRYRRKRAEAILPEISPSGPERTGLFVKVYSLAGVREAISSGADIIYYNIFSKDVPDAMAIGKEKLYLEVPAITYDSQIPFMLERIREHNPSGLLLGNPALLNHGLTQKIHLGYSFNLFNDYDLLYWKELGIISPELNYEELCGLRNKNFIVHCHGNLVVMKSRQLLNHAILRDGKSEEFPVRLNPAGYTEILNSREIGMYNYVRDLLRVGIRYFYLDLDRDVSRTVSAYRKIAGGQEFDDSKARKSYTTGHLKRGVE